MDILFIYFIIYSFIGFLLETAYVYLMDGQMEKRGFNHGSVIPIYGFGALAIILILEPYMNNIALLFIFGILLTSTLEYITSYVMEKIFDLRWWDYREQKHNLNGRICLRNSVMFGILSVVLILFIHPQLENL